MLIPSFFILTCHLILLLLLLFYIITSIMFIIYIQPQRYMYITFPRRWNNRSYRWYLLDLNVKSTACTVGIIRCCNLIIILTVRRTMTSAPFIIATVSSKFFVIITSLYSWIIYNPIGISPTITTIIIIVGVMNDHVAHTIIYQIGTPSSNCNFTRLCNCLVYYLIAFRSWSVDYWCWCSWL